MVFSGVNKANHLSRQTIRHFSSAQYFYNTKQGKKNNWEGSCLPNYFLALFQVIKIWMYEMLPCFLPANRFCLVCT